MKEAFIANNDINSVVVQCACIGHCSYLEFMNLMDNRLCLSIATTNRKKKYIKNINKIEEVFNLTDSQADVFINMLENIETVHSNTFVIRDEKCDKNGKLYIRFEYIPLNKTSSKYDQVAISFYLKYKNFQNNKCDFDITISRNMLRSLVKSLRGLYEKE